VRHIIAYSELKIKTFFKMDWELSPYCFVDGRSGGETGIKDR
jgi:hypothetical protein